MASTVEQLLNPETPLATPADVRQPFAAKDTYFVPKSESHLLFGKLDFAAGKTKSIKNMELLSSAQMRSARTAGSFLLDTLMNFTYKESGNPVIAISLRLCFFRSAHKDEIESFEEQIKNDVEGCFTSTRCQLLKTSVIAFNATKKKELNRAVVYNTVIHNNFQGFTLLGSGVHSN